MLIQNLKSKNKYIFFKSSEAIVFHFVRLKKIAKKKTEWKMKWNATKGILISQTQLISSFFLNMTNVSKFAVCLYA